MAAPHPTPLPMTRGEREKDNVRRGSLLFTALVVTLCLGLWLATPKLITNYRVDVAFFEGPAFFPRLALGVAILGGLWHLVERWLGRVREEAAEEIEIGASRAGVAFAGVALLAGYILAAPYIGYAGSTAIFMAIAARVAGLGWWLALALSAATTAVLYAVFVIGLKVWFPVPLVVRWLGG